MLNKVNRLLSAYYDAIRNGEKRRAAIIYRMLWDLGVIVNPD